MKILVTGASGFVGSHLVEAALARGWEVWAAVRERSSRAWLKDGCVRFLTLTLDKKDTLLRELLAHKAAEGKWDYVIHAAGVTKCRQKDDFMRVNAQGTRHLAEALVEAGMVPEKFVFLSSLSVMGALHEEAVGTAGSPFRYPELRAEETPQPDTLYGKSKLEAERLLAQVKALPSVTLRLTGVYGPRERDYYLMARSIKRHVDFSVGWKRQELTFVYVKDVAQAALLALEKGRSGSLYLVSDGSTYTSDTFSRLLQREMGIRGVLHIKSPLCILWLVSRAAEALGRFHRAAPTLNSDKYKIMKQRNWRCDITPLRHDLGYTPEYPLERGVKETVRWYKEEKWI